MEASSPHWFDPSGVLRERLIDGRHGAPGLEVVEAHPSGPPEGAPILFVHGAFGGAWMWRETFMPYLARRGRASLALSLRGHGRSETPADRRQISLGDYLDDLRRAFAQVEAAPVVVAHSLGGLLAQMLIGQEDMRAIVLLGSLPPEGMFWESPRLAITDPALWAEAFIGSVSDTRLPIELAGHKVLFSEGLPPEKVRRYSAMLVPESPRALMEAHLPMPIIPAFLCGIPALVMRGSLDRLVWHASSLRTALFHGGDHRTLEGAGHFLQLDAGAEVVAGEVVRWLDEARL
jgi:pimeloyl-ACP methyl ester carboxylesterase